MAKRITSEDLVLNLILNADKVESGNKTLLNQLYKLDRATRDLETKMMDLERQKRRLSKSSKTYATDLARIDGQMKKVKAQILSNRAEMMKLREQIGRAGLTINQLNSHLQALRIQLRNATDPTVLKRLRLEIQRTQMQMERMTTGMSRMAQAWRSMGAAANKFGTLMGWIMLSVYGLGRAIFGVTQNMRQLDRQFSEVMKTTGLTREEVMRLKRDFDELNKMDGAKTPTKTKDLLDIARIAGRLGVRGVEEIGAFTLAVDKLYVALGEDLEGTVEEITEKVGKMVKVFKLTDEMPLSEALLRAGSLINELGKRSEASAETILNYTSRLGGVGSMAKFSIDQLAGMGATLDSVGVKAERGSTALVKLIVGLGQHADKFARIMGVTEEEYRRMIDENVNEVFVKLLETTGKQNDSILEVVQGMGDMEVSGVRVAEVFGKLSQNVELLRQQQDIASRAFASSASVMEEFYIRSQDWDALFAIQGKRVKSLADDYSKALTPSLYKAYRGIVDFGFATRDAGKWLVEHSHLIKGIIALIVLMKATKIGMWIKSVYEKLMIEIGYRRILFSQYLKTNKALVAMRAAYASAGGGIKGATAALRAFAAALWANPWTAAVAAVASLAAVFFLTRKRIDDVTKVTAKMSEEIQTQSRHMKALFDTTMAAADGSKERAQGIRTINELYGQYLPKLLTEADNVDTIAASYAEANKKLQEQIALKFRNDSYDEVVAKQRQKRLKKQQKDLAAVKKEFGAGAFGQAMFELDQLIMKLAEETDQGKVNQLRNAFLKKWNEYNRGDGITKQDIIDLTNMYQEELMQERALSASIEGYIKGMTEEERQRVSGGGADDLPMMTEGEFEARKAQLELELDKEKLLLQQSILDKDELHEQELKAEAAYLEKYLALVKEKWTRYKLIWGDNDYKKLSEEQKEKTVGIEGVLYLPELIGGEKEILDAEAAYWKNLLEMRANGYELTEKQLKTALTQEEIGLLQNYQNKEDFRMKELKAEENFLRQMLQLTIQKYTDEMGVIQGGEKEIADAEKALLENQIAQRQMLEEAAGKKKGGGKGKSAYEEEQEALKDHYLEVEVIMLRELEKKTITQRQFDEMMLQLEVQHQLDLMKVAVKYGEDTLEIEKEYLEKRAAQRASMGKYTKALGEAWAYGFGMEEEEEVKDPAIEKYLKSRDRIRRFLSLDKDQETEEGMGIFETKDFEGQIAQLESWYAQGIMSHEEFERRKTDITREQTNHRLDLSAQMLSGLNDMLGAYGGLYQAQKDAELQAVGNNEKKKLAIQKKYAKKEQNIAAAQAFISGALAIMRIMEAKATGNALLDAIIKPVLIGLTVATTAAQIKAIKTQQFAKGKYPVIGKDDGRMYNAEYVGVPRTGIYQKPSLGLFAEKPEMVIDNPTLRNIQINSPGLIDAIMAHRGGSVSSAPGKEVRQYAQGNYPGTGTAGGYDAEMKELLRQNTRAIEKLSNQKFKVYVDLIKKGLEELDEIELESGL